MKNSHQDENVVYPVGTVVLNDEEHQECQETLRSFLAIWKRQEDDLDGEFIIENEFAETFQRSIIAYALMRRAERFSEPVHDLFGAGGHPDGYMQRQGRGDSNEG